MVSLALIFKVTGNVIPIRCFGSHLLILFFSLISLQVIEDDAIIEVLAGYAIYTGV